MTGKSRRSTRKSQAKSLSLKVARAELNRLDALRSGDLKTSLEVQNEERRIRSIEIDFDKIKTSEDAEYAKHQIHKAMLSGQISGKVTDHLLEHIHSIRASILRDKRAEEESTNYKRAMKEEIELFPARLAHYKSLQPNEKVLYTSNNPIFYELFAEHEKKELFKAAKLMRSKGEDKAESKSKRPKTQRRRSKAANASAQVATDVRIENGRENIGINRESRSEVADSEYAKTVLPQPQGTQPLAGQSASREPKESQLAHPHITEDSFKFIPNKPVPPRVGRW